MAETIATHDLKCWPEPFVGVWHGFKRHEVRKDDRGFKLSDVLLLREWNPATGEYGGRWVEAEITYISRGPAWGLPDGLVVMSIRPIRQGGS